MVGQMHLLQVAMGERNQPPDHGEEQPRSDEAEGKHEQRPAPLGVHKGCEDVLQEAQVLLRNLGSGNIALAALQDGPFAVLASCARPECSTSVKKGLKGKRKLVL